jgi:hypothetical protein
MPKPSNFNRKTNNLIASLRGLPKDRSRAFWKDEKDLNAVMDRVIERFHISEVRPEEAILADWTSIVGDRNASHSHPHRLEHGFRLYVLVNNPVVKQEMQFHKKMIKTRLNKIPGCEGIREIIFRAG